MRPDSNRNKKIGRIEKAGRNKRKPIGALKLIISYALKREREGESLTKKPKKPTRRSWANLVSRLIGGNPITASALRCNEIGGAPSLLQTCGIARIAPVDRGRMLFGSLNATGPCCWWTRLFLRGWTDNYLTSYTKRGTLGASKIFPRRPPVKGCFYFNLKSNIGRVPAPRGPGRYGNACDNSPDFSF
jgi:hypothetical protein